MSAGGSRSAADSSRTELSIGAIRVADKMSAVDQDVALEALVAVRVAR